MYLTLVSKYPSVHQMHIGYWHLSSVWLLASGDCHAYFKQAQLALQLHKDGDVLLLPVPVLHDGIYVVTTIQVSLF